LSRLAITCWYVLPLVSSWMILKDVIKHLMVCYTITLRLQMKLRVGPNSTLIRLRTDHYPLLPHLDALFDVLFSPQADWTTLPPLV